MNDTLIRMLTLAGKGYSCSQILITLALEARGESNPALVRAVAGLAYGCGSGGTACGALTGGACVLALYAGKGIDEETSSERLLPMLQELSDWFGERVGSAHGGITCDAVVGKAGPHASRQICGAIVAETFEKAMEILTLNGFDLAGGEP
jgi:hypothetical protein